MPASGRSAWLVSCDICERSSRLFRRQALRLSSLSLGAPPRSRWALPGLADLGAQSQTASVPAQTVFRRYSLGHRLPLAVVRPGSNSPTLDFRSLAKSSRRRLGALHLLEVLEAPQPTPLRRLQAAPEVHQC